MLLSAGHVTFNRTVRSTSHMQHPLPFTTLRQARAAPTPSEIEQVIRATIKPLISLRRTSSCCEKSENRHGFHLLLYRTVSTIMRLGLETVDMTCVAQYQSVVAQLLLVRQTSEPDGG